MLHKTITYNDLDGNPVTEDFWFQITKSEVAKKALIEGEDYGARLQTLIEERDGAKIMEQWEALLREAVGKREDKLFVKTAEIQKHFMFSGAYDAFFMELISSPDSGASMVRAMFPADAQAEIEKSMQERGVVTAELPATSEQPAANITGTEADAQVQAEKPQLTFEHGPDIFPANLEKAVEANKPGKDDDPAWLTEGRSPTRQEMMKMSKEELQFVFKMKEAGLVK